MTVCAGRDRAGHFAGHRRRSRTGRRIGGGQPLEEPDAAVFFGRDAQIVPGADVIRGTAQFGVRRSCS